MIIRDEADQGIYRTDVEAPLQRTLDKFILLPRRPWAELLRSQGRRHAIVRDTSIEIFGAFAHEIETFVKWHGVGLRSEKRIACATAGGPDRTKLNPDRNRFRLRISADADLAPGAGVLS